MSVQLGRLRELLRHEGNLLLVGAPLVRSWPSRMSSFDHSRHLVFLLVQLLQHLMSGLVDSRSLLAQDGRVGLDHLLNWLVGLLILSHV